LNGLLTEGTVANDALEICITILFLATPAYLLGKLFWSNREFIKRNKSRFFALLLLLVPTVFCYIAASSPLWMDVFNLRLIGRLFLTLKFMYGLVAVGLLLSLGLKVNRRSTAVALSLLNISFLLALHMLAMQLLPVSIERSNAKVFRVTQEDSATIKQATQKKAK
jgi:hypothetical protein